MRYWVLICMSVLLQACSTLSPKGSEELQQGKTSYEAGEFKKALHELLPPAAAGNAKAQYAIGYLYYNGYGTTQDTEAGIFWMKRAADHHYQPAIKALKLINEQNQSPDVIKDEQRAEKDREVTPVLEQEREQYDQVMATSPAPTKIAVPKKETPIEPVTLKEEQKTNDEVLRSIKFSAPKKVSEAQTKPEQKVAQVQPEPESSVKKEIHADGYGLQLLGSYDLESVKKMQTSLSVRDSSVIWHAEHNKKDWYVLMYGHYNSIANAKFAMDSLPTNLRERRPWVRNLSGLG